MNSVFDQRYLHKDFQVVLSLGPMPWLMAFSGRVAQAEPARDILLQAAGDLPGGNKRLVIEAQLFQIDIQLKGTRDPY
jgi:hypothetical protein